MPWQRRSGAGRSALAAVTDTFGAVDLPKDTNIANAICGLGHRLDPG
jgi:hypothetical protein